MSDKETTWTGRWVAEKIMDNDNIEDIKIVESQILSVRRKHNESFVLGTTAVDCVNSTVVRKLRPEGLDTLSFIVNIPKESFWTGEAISLISQHSMAFGGMSDLYRALSCTDVREYINPEFDFVERILDQHDVVKTMTRVHDRKYVLGRRGLPDFTIVLINEYELTKDHVRRARDRYKAFRAILITNPNGTATTQAKEVAKSMDIEIHNIRQLMVRINER